MNSRATSPASISDETVFSALAYLIFRSVEAVSTPSLSPVSLQPSERKFRELIAFPAWDIRDFGECLPKWPRRINAHAR
jgi:hypothetical protein